MKLHAAIMSALCASAAAACVPDGWPPGDATAPSPDAACDAADGTDAATSADAGCPVTGCDRMTGDIGGMHFPRCGDEIVGWGPASSFVDFVLDDGESRVIVRLAYEPSLPLGVHDFDDLTYPVTVGLTPELGGPDIGAVSVAGALTLEEEVWRVDLTATFDVGAISGCIDGEPLS